MPAPTAPAPVAPPTSSASNTKPADRYAQSKAAFVKAKAVMPGGVSSPVRAYKAVGRDPITIRSGKGATVTDLDGNEYLDYVGSYGPLILGHTPDAIVAAITKTAGKGTTFGMPTELETRLAEAVIAAVPSIEMVRFVNSGTEAAMSALRLARAATGRDKMIKCRGCYHGHTDALLVQAGSGATTLGTPSSPGVPADVTASTLLVEFNDLDAVREAFEANPGEIACMAVEPVAGNMGVVPPQSGYLQGLRELCDEHGALLLFDEVMTGFRVAYGGAQSLFGVRPDLTCLGKIVGGGLPCAAYGGREDLMRQVAPDGPVYQAGTLSGNPLAMAAGLATLNALNGESGTLDNDAEDAEGPYELLERLGSKLEKGLVKHAEKAGVPVQVQRVGSMICVFFRDEPVRNYTDALACDTGRFAAFFNTMLDAGIVLPPSQYESWFLSTAHDDAAIKATLKAAKEAFAASSRI